MPTRLRPLCAALLIAALGLLFFWKLVFTNLILVGVDSFLYFYPYKAYVTEALRAGHLPLWNPHLFMGAPLLANMQVALLYPLHWPLIWLAAPKQVAASLVLHVVLAGWGAVVYARRTLKLGWAGALTAAVIFALGGFLGAQAEHVNQLNVMAWLPWALWLLDAALTNRRRAASALGLGLVIALMLLAGHAQAVYICLVGLGLYALAGGWGQDTNHKSVIPREHAVSTLKSLAAWRLRFASRLPYLATLALALGVASLLAAAQLLPTWELSRLSVRSEGLSYREAVSFSLRPWQLQYTLLPPFGADLSQVFGEAYSEYVAYVGVIGLGLAAFGLLRGWRRWPGTRFLAILAATGLFLGLGGFNPIYFLLYTVIPGFDLFRAPARWMLLYALGMAMLAGIGVEQISTHRSPSGNIKHQISNHASRITHHVSRITHLIPPILVVLVCAELFLASRGLAYNQPTAPEAFSFLRPSIAHLKTDPGLGRFLSLSGIVYDPGDLAEMRAMFTGQLPEPAIYAYVVAAKEKEVLSYNLPLLYGLYSVDGYDGGLLPLHDFVTMQLLFLNEDNVSLDGRLRERLREVPAGRLLSLLGVKYVITDKVFDAWIDGLFYDLQFPAQLSPGGVPSVSTSELPNFPTTSLGVVSHLEGASQVPDGTPVARIHVADQGGWSATFDLLAGQDTSEGRYSGQVAHRQARVGQAWRDDASGTDYVALIPLDGPRRLTTLSVTGIAPAGEFVLRGLSLVDTRTTTTRQLTLSGDGHYRLVHSGDVKIYENLDVLPRAFVVHRAEVIPDDEQAIARMRDPAFDPAGAAILADGQPLTGAGVATTQVVAYAPEQVVVDVTTDAPGYLMLTDTFYPGWEAAVDGRPTPILRADVLFRAVRLEPGTHRVEFRYRPASLRWGTWISVVAALLWVGGMIGVLLFGMGKNGRLDNAKVGRVED